MGNSAARPETRKMHELSQVYGSDPDLGSHLRNLTNDLGRMREGPSFGYGKPLLPFNNGLPVDCRRDPRESNIGCFLAGDVRANEQLGLLALHTVWLREHNRVAGALRRLNPHWDGDRLFHEARKVVGAQMQAKFEPVAFFNLFQAALY